MRPHAFINAQQIQDHNFALKVMPHLPNYFVGVGLLLTFVGLVAALNFASGSVGGNIDETLGGLENLLAAATFKFWTSIAGLGASIVLSFLFRIYSNMIDRALVSVCDVIESKLHFLTAQSIFAEIQKTGDEQLAETKKINSEVAFTIGKTINENLNQQFPQALHTALQPITDEVRRTSEAIVSRNTESVGDMVQEFADSLQGGASAHMQTIAGTLEQLQSTLQQMQGSMDSSGDQFSRRIADGTERLEVTMREVSGSVSELVAQLREQMAEAGTSITGQLEQTLSRISEESEAAAGQLAAQGTSASRQFAETVEAAARSLQESATANAKASGDAAERMRDELQRSAANMDASVTRLAERLQQVDGGLAKQAQAFANVAQQEAEVAKSLQSSSRSLQEGVAPWQAVGEQLGQTVRAVEQSLAESSRRLDEAFGVTRELAERLTTLTRTLEEGWDAYRQRFEGVDKDLERAFQQITEAVDTQQRRIQDFVKALDKSFSEATDKLNGTIAGMASSAEDLADAVEQWSEATRPASGSSR